MVVLLGILIILMACAGLMVIYTTILLGAENEPKNKAKKGDRK